LLYRSMKFLYNDGSGTIREVGSKAELDYYLSISPDKSRVRIWLFHNSSWITWQEYSKMDLVEVKQRETIVAKPINEVKEVVAPAPPIDKPKPARSKRTVTKPLQILLNICIVLVVAGGVYAALFYNTKEWSDEKAFEVTATRPENAPALSIDSIIHSLEVKEKKTLGTLTKMNLRLRNNWPEKIVLVLKGQRQQQLKKDSIHRFTKLEWIVKNSTGYEIDEAEAVVTVWKNGSAQTQDSYRITGIGLREPANLPIPNTYKGDSLTIHFKSLRSFGLNFCYTYDQPTISGNPNDKWFCKD
jgi:hypothetical protein